MDPVNLYFNTFAFTILSGVIIIVILAGLLYGSAGGTMKRFTPFFVAFEVGLLVIILFALYSVISYENSRKKDRKLRNDKRRVKVLSCPDYWTLHENGKGLRECKRRYNIPGSTTDWITMEGNKNSVDMNKYDMQPLNDACTSLDKELKTSWSGLNAECNAYS